MGKLSPLMEQYYSAKRQCQDALLLFRMGDFYETFGEDAVVAARELNITLTSRQKDDEGNKIPLAGVPYHALDAYLAKLVKAGHKVAICEQVEDPKLAKGLVRREITRVVTPGTIIEPSMLEERSNNYLAAVAEDGKTFGLALVDVSTGEFLATLLSSREKLSVELARFRPSECLVPSGFSLPNGGDKEIKIQRMQEGCISSEQAKALLKELFEDPKIPGLPDDGPAIQAVGAVLAYLKNAHLQALGHITSIRVYSPEEGMILDEVTLRNLEIFRSIRDRSKRGSLLEFLDRTKTSMGSRTLGRWLAMPSRSIGEITSRQQAVEDLVREAMMRGELQSTLEGTGDLERLLGRISCGNATPKDLVSLSQALAKLPLLCEALSPARSSCLQELRRRLHPGSLEELRDLIGRAITDDPPTSLRDGGVIKDGYHQELDLLRQALRDGRGWISRLEGAERQRTGIKSLKVGYNNVFGYYIEVTKPHLSQVPKEYLRKQTTTNAERFVTPELKDMEARVLSAQERSAALEQDLFKEIRSQIAAKAEEVQIRALALGELDVLLSLAEVALEGNYVKPQLQQTGAIALLESRHPILDKAMRGAFVPNDVHLDNEKRFTILTGPNMAGKSTFMRQVALTVILAQIGSFVPASYASISLVDRIFTRVGAYDDLVAGQSTFMVEMTELAHILSLATDRSLVLLDEIGRGTSTFDGLAIAWAVCEHLHSAVRAKTIFATHYHQLTQLAERLKGISNYNMAVREEGEGIVFLRTVVPGATDRSYGIHVARLAGVPQGVVKRAWEILKEIEREIQIEQGRPKREGPRYTQLIFFDNPLDNDPLIEEIKSLKIENMTPVEALTKLAEYQKILRER